MGRTPTGNLGARVHVAPGRALVVATATRLRYNWYSNPCGIDCFGCAVYAKVAPLGKLSGGDAAAVRELKHACHTNCANCLLKLERWEAAVAECDVVLGHGPNRKALFRRAQALEKLDQDEEARAGFQQALKMEEDATVRACLVALEARMGVDDEPDAASEAAPAAAAPAAPMMPRPGMPGMPGMGPNGMPDPVQMEKMLDQITPEQMAQQAEMLENMDEAQLKAMAPQLGGMDPSMMKGMAVRDAAQFFGAIPSAQFFGAIL